MPTINTTEDFFENDVQVLAAKYNSDLYSELCKKEKCEFPECSAGRIRLRKGKNKYILAFYLEDENEVLRVCLDKIISCVKGLKSIGFVETEFTDAEFDVVEEWAEENDSIKVYFFDKELTYSSMNLIEYTQQYTPEGWEDFFDNFIENEGMDKISNFLSKESKSQTIYPPLPDIYAAFEACPPRDIKVVIIGQDPYHTPGAAMGIAFGHHSTRKAIQPSLRNIYKELINDIPECSVNMKSGDLTSWTEQGVFLINTALTVRKGEAKSHGNKSSGWSYFTDQLFRYLDDNCKHLVVIMWGLPAKKKGSIFDKKKHYTISSAHPSGLSAHKGFFGSRPFSKTNQKLEKWGMEPIDWTIE